jgi:DNA-binding FrmR family transcriptional regulator
VGDEEADMVGYIEGKDALLARLRRVEGQVRGLQRMVESETYCIDVLTQVSAATKALQAVALELLADHLAHCVADATREGGEVAEVKLKEASAAIARVEVDLVVGGDSRVAVTTASPLAVESVRAAVQEAGYDLAGVNR